MQMLQYYSTCLIRDNCVMLSRTTLNFGVQYSEYTSQMYSTQNCTPHQSAAHTFSVQYMCLVIVHLADVQAKLLVYSTSLWCTVQCIYF